MRKEGYVLPKFQFLVEWNGNGEEEIGFTEVSGLDMEFEEIKYREGNDPRFRHHMQPGLIKYTNITLKRGYFLNQNSFFTEWQKRSTTLVQNREEVERRTVVIKLIGDNGDPLVKWTVRRAWVKKLQSTDLKADGNEPAIETLELCHEGITVEFLNPS